MASSHSQHTATLLPDGKVLVAGGFGGDGSQATAEVYHPALGAWGSAGSMASRRASFTAVLLPNGKVLVAGGHNPDGNYELAGAELFTP
jgi:hypothetical protein